MHACRSTRPLAATAVAALLLACGGSGSGVTVSGQVLDGSGQPLANLTVLVGGKSTTTDTGGNFTVTGVTTPYDAIIVETANKVATVYAQLTRSDPKLLDFGSNGSPATHTATLGGAIVGGDPLSTAGTITAISWGSVESSTGSYVTSTPYSFPVSWSGPTGTTGSVHGLQWTVDGNGTVTGYRSHGVKPGVSLTAGGTVSDADVLLTVPTTTSVSATITAPAGYTIADRSAYLTFADGAYFPVSEDALASSAFSLPVPSGIEASVIMNATATESVRNSITTAQLSGLAPGTSGAALTLPSPAVATAPADGATGVDTTTDLVWSPVLGGVHVLFLSGAGNDPAFAIVSGGTQTRIPDLSAQGLGLPSGRPYDWTLLALGPFASIDAFATAGVLSREGLGFETVTSTGFTTR